jgi:hypothetical protein
MDIASTSILSVFAYVLMIVIAGLAALLIRGIVLALARMQAKAAEPTPVSIGVEPAVDETAGHVAAIAAAVYAILGAHRLVHIGEAAPGPAWTATGRLAHHASHAPQRTRR